MTVNNPELYNDGFWDWAILDGCFGATKIAPTDIDGCVERGGHILIIETKKPGAKIKDGQLYTFEAMVATGVITVFVVWGTKNHPVQMQEFHLAKSGKEVTPIGPYDANLDKFRERVSAWYQMADNHRRDKGVKP